MEVNKLMTITVQEILAIPPFLSALVFGTAGVVGLFRFPDPYSRLQMGGLCGTTAVFSVFIMALLLSPGISVTARVVIIMFFFLISAPTGSHIVARFTWNAGVFPWKGDTPPPRRSRRSKT
jgi:multicomponent Na+:H+ antiporter subunit G